MKNLLALSLLAMISSSSFAATVAQIRIGGGFTRVPQSITISVDADGTVTREKVSGSWNNPDLVTTETVNVATLNPSIVEEVLKEIAESTTMKVVAEDPKAPECTDVPTTTFSVVKDGELAQIGKNQSCKKFRLDDYQGRGAIRILESLLTLSNSAK